MASKTTYHYFSGKGSWCQKLFSPDMEYGTWQVKLNFNDKSYADFMKLKEADGETDGILNEVKQDDDGYYHVFKRPIKKEYKDRTGTQQTLFFDPPVVLDAKKLDANGNPTPWDKNTPIGNGSDITIKVECYRYNKPFKKGQGRAIRLQSVMVENLVPYEKSSLTEGQQKQVEGLDQQPKQMW